MSEPVKVMFNPYAVDVYAPNGEFMGGITLRRMSTPDPTYSVADAVACILKAMGHDVLVEEERVKR